jgi:hypothetical protein
MGTIVRHEFLGNRLWFWLLCVSGIGLPLAVLYLLDTVVKVKEEVPDAAAFLEAFRARRTGA